MAPWSALARSWPSASCCRRHRDGRGSGQGGWWPLPWLLAAPWSSSAAQSSASLHVAWWLLGVRWSLRTRCRPLSLSVCLSVSCVQMSYLGKWTIKSVYFATDLCPVNTLSCLCARRYTLVHNGRHTVQWRGSPSQCNVPGPRECSLGSRTWPLVRRRARAEP